MAFFVLALAREFAAFYVVAHLEDEPVLALELPEAESEFCLQENFNEANSVILASPCTVKVAISSNLADTEIFSSPDNQITAASLNLANLNGFFTATSTSFPEGWNCYSDKETIEYNILNYPVEVARAEVLVGENRVRFSGTSVFALGGAALEIEGATANLTVASDLEVLPNEEIIACAQCQQQFVFQGKRVDFAEFSTDSAQVQWLNGQRWEALAGAAIMQVRPQPGKVAILVRTDFSQQQNAHLRLYIEYNDICGNTSYFWHRFSYTEIEEYEVLFAQDHYYTACGAPGELSCACRLQAVSAESGYGFQQLDSADRISFAFQGAEKLKILPYSQTDYLYYCEGDAGSKFALQIANDNGSFANDEQTKVCVDKEFYIFNNIPEDCRYVERKISGSLLTATYSSCLDYQATLSVEYRGFEVTHSREIGLNGVVDVTVNTSGSTVRAVYGQKDVDTKQCDATTVENRYQCVFSQFGLYKVYALIDTECQLNEPYFLFDHEVAADAYMTLINNAAWRPEDFTGRQQLIANYIYYYRFSTEGMSFEASSCTFEQNEHQIILSGTGDCELLIQYRGNTIFYQITILAGAIALNPECAFASNEYDTHEAAMTLYDGVYYSTVCTVTLEDVQGVQTNEVIPQDNLTVNGQPSQYFKAAARLECKYYIGYEIVLFTVDVQTSSLQVASLYQYDALTVNEKLAFLESFAPTEESDLSKFIVRNFHNCSQNCVVNAYYEPLSSSMVRLAKLSNYPADTVERELAAAFIENRLAFYRLFSPTLAEFQELAKADVFSEAFAYLLFNAAPVIQLQEDVTLQIALASAESFSLFSIFRISTKSQFQTPKTSVSLLYQEMPPSFEGVGCKIGVIDTTMNQSVITFCQGDSTIVFAGGKGQCMIHQFTADETAYSSGAYTSQQLQRCTQINETSEVTCGCVIGQHGGHILLYSVPEGLTGWEIFGIVVGVLIGVALIVLAVLLALKYCKGGRRGIRSVRNLP